MRKFYAIGFKNHVELRSSRFKPREKVSTATFKSNLTNQSIPIRVVHHRGGRVVKTMLSNVFSILTGIYVAEGECKEVAKAAVAKLPEVKDG